MTKLRTKLCDILGIEYPIIQAGMGYVAYAELAAAVSNAGGMGVVACGTLPPDEVRRLIRKTKTLTDRPFGADLIFPARADEAKEGLKLPDPPPEPIIKIKAELKALGIEVQEGPPDPKKDSYLAFERAEQSARVALEEGVAAIAAGLGTPAWLVEEAHARGIKIMSLVGRVKDALRVEAMGADIIVAQGHEAGGHTGRITNFVLLPQVVDVVKVPVLAAGGIMDGRGLVAALAMGACGVWVGTRFIATKESAAHPAHKARIIAADENATVWARVYDGLGHRHLRNRLDELWEGHEHEILPFPHQRGLMGPILNATRAASADNYMHLSAGQGAATVKEEESAGDVVRVMVEEAAAILKGKFKNEISFA